MKKPGFNFIEVTVAMLIFLFGFQAIALGTLKNQQHFNQVRQSRIAWRILVNAAVHEMPEPSEPNDKSFDRNGCFDQTTGFYRLRGRITEANTDLRVSWSSKIGVMELPLSRILELGP
jgi:Tfp pilus assembly protein PilV